MRTDGTAPQHTTAHDRSTDEYSRGCRDGIAWARDYATPEELRDLVESFAPGDAAGFDMSPSLHEFMRNNGHTKPVSVPGRDSPFWQGFVAGAEEVLTNASPPLTS